MGPYWSPLSRVVVVVVVVVVDIDVQAARNSTTSDVVNGREAARSGELAQHFSNVSCS